MGLPRMASLGRMMGIDLFARLKLTMHLIDEIFAYKGEIMLKYIKKVILMGFKTQISDK
jgi:hypothetical protein